MALGVYINVKFDFDNGYYYTLNKTLVSTTSLKAYSTNGQLYLEKFKSFGTEFN